MTIPDAAIEAAMSAWDAANMDDGGPIWLEDMWRVAIEAAVPAIREAIAQEIEAQMADVLDDDGDAVTAIYIVRGGAA